MTTINREFETGLLMLNAAALKANIPCPPLIALNNWTLEQMKAVATAPAPATSRPGTNGAAPGVKGSGTFDEVVLTAVKASPDGVAIGDLQSQAAIAAYKKPNNQIGAALGRLAKKALVQKKGDLWLIKPSRGRPAASGKASTVDKTIGARRNRRARGAAKAGVPEAQGTEQAAAAGN